MIENKLQYYQKTANYEARKNAQEIPDESIVFVEEAHDIIVRGHSFGVSDGSITSDKLAPDSVNTKHITDEAVTKDKIASNSISEDKIENGAVTSDKLGEQSVTSDKIASGSITADHIANGAITSDNISQGSITGDKLAFNSVTSEHIVDGTILTTDLDDSVVTNSKLAKDSVSTNKIVDLSVTEAKLADGAVTTDKIGYKSITADKIGDDVAMGVPDKSIITPKLADEAVTTPKIADGAVTSGKLADYAVKTDKLANQSVTSDKIADETILLKNLSPSIFENFNDTIMVEVNQKIKDLIGTAPEALDTLGEIAEKLADNDDAVAVIINQLTELKTDKADLSKLAKVATSGSYRDLDDKPFIPSSLNDLEGIDNIVQWYKNSLLISEAFPSNPHFGTIKYDPVESGGWPDDAGGYYVCLGNGRILLASDSGNWFVTSKDKPWTNITGICPGLTIWGRPFEGQTEIDGKLDNVTGINIVSGKITYGYDTYHIAGLTPRITNIPTNNDIIYVVLYEGGDFGLNADLKNGETLTVIFYASGKDIEITFDKNKYHSTESSISIKAGHFAEVSLLRVQSMNFVRTCVY